MIIKLPDNLYKIKIGNYIQFGDYQFTGLFNKDDKRITQYNSNSPLKVYEAGLVDNTYTDIEITYSKNMLNELYNTITTPKFENNSFTYVNNLNGSFLELESQLKDFSEDKNIFKNVITENLNKKIKELEDILCINFSNNTVEYRYSKYNMRAAKGESVVISSNNSLGTIKAAYYIEFPENKKPKLYGIFRGIPIEFLGRSTSTTSAIYTAPEIAFLKSEKNAEDALENVFVVSDDISNINVYSGTTNNFVNETATSKISNRNLITFKNN